MTAQLREAAQELLKLTPDDSSTDWNVAFNKLHDALSQPEPGPEPVPGGKNWHAHHVVVSKAALQMVRNALRRDVERGLTVRIEMLAELDAATYQVPAQPEPVVGLTDEEIDQILSTPIPGGSQASHWFLPHDTDKGLANVRDVVRAMLTSARAILARTSAPAEKAEPVAVIGPGWAFFWASGDSIADIVKRHNLKIGDKLYTHAQPAREPMTGGQAKGDPSGIPGMFKTTCPWCENGFTTSLPPTDPPARLLSSEELAACCGGCASNSAIETWMRRAIAKFCEVNSITAQGGEKQA